MKVILTSDIKGKGKSGDIIEVNDNYGKNCIINKGLGVEATPANLNNLKLQKKNADKIEAENIAKATEYKEIIENHEVVLGVKVGKDGKLFGSITTKEIADTIEKSLSIKIDKKNISGGVLNQLGETSVKIKLHKTVTEDLKVKITSF